MKAAQFFLIFVLISAVSVCREAEAVCCPCPALWRIFQCGFCLGEGDCNIFCCNCDNGVCLPLTDQCYKPAYYALHGAKIGGDGSGNDGASPCDADNTTEAVRFACIDSNDDGFIDLHEARRFAGDGFTAAKFAAIDDTGDGKVSWGEFSHHA